MKKKEVKLSKIPLQSFIETLIAIYERGAEYIDIIGVPDAEQDSLVVVVKDDYMSLDEEHEPPPIIKKSSKLTDDDLNELL